MLRNANACLPLSATKHGLPSSRAPRTRPGLLPARVLQIEYNSEKPECPTRYLREVWDVRGRKWANELKVGTRKLGG